MNLRKYILKVFNMTPTHEDKEFLKELNENASPSMSVEGRGTLMMSASDARKTIKIKVHSIKNTSSFGDFKVKQPPNSLI